VARARRNTWGPTADPSKSISFPRAECGSVHAGGAHGRASQIASDPVCAMSNERQQLGLLRSKGWNPGWLQLLSAAAAAATGEKAQGAAERSRECVVLHALFLFTFCGGILRFPGHIRAHYSS
jgi:hypothetical protein